MPHDSDLMSAEARRPAGVQPESTGRLPSDARNPNQPGRACRGADAAPCALHVALHGCGVNGYYDNEVHHLSFTRWAETNRMVVVFPRMAQHGAVEQEEIGCWDAYAQTGADYAFRQGAQMVAVREMVKALAGV